MHDYLIFGIVVLAVALLLVGVDVYKRQPDTRAKEPDGGASGRAAAQRGRRAAGNIPLFFLLCGRALWEHGPFESAGTGRSSRISRCV